MAQSHLLFFAVIQFLKFVYILSLTVSEFTQSDIVKVGYGVSSKYVNNQKCNVIVAENCDTEDNIVQILNLPQFGSNFLILLNHVMDDMSYKLVLYKVIESAFEEACNGFIIQLSRPLNFLSAWRKTAKTSRHRHNPRILFLPTERNKIISPELLESKEIRSFFDFLIVDFHLRANSDIESSFEIISSSWNFTRDVIATCRASKCLDMIEDLNPIKVLNLDNRELRMATFNYKPYAILEPLDGTEVRIVLEYSRLHNCSINVVTDGAEWGTIYNNGSGDGILGNVAEEKADLGLGALYLWYHEYQFLDFSTPYIRTGITCLAPKPKLLSRLYLHIRPFTMFTWLVLITAMPSSCVALYITKKLHVKLFGKENSKRNKISPHWFTTMEDTSLRTFGFLVLQAYNSRVLETSGVRHLVNCLHITFLLLTVGYISGLTSLLTVPPYEPPIDSVGDLVSSGLPWGATHDAWIYSLREESDPDMRSLVNRFQALSKNQLHRSSLSSDFAFSVERLPAGHFAVGDYITEDSLKHLRLMKDDIYFEHCIIVFQKGSPYLESFNTLIHLLLQSGLLLYWEGEVARKFLHSPLQAAIRDSATVLTTAQPSAITFSHLQAAFIILAAGLSSASVTFLLELFVQYKCSGPYYREIKARKGKVPLKKTKVRQEMPYYGFYK